MQDKSDAQLLREYAEHGVEAAFTEMVARHTNLVYSAALRQSESPDVAAEITQRVFVALTQGASELSRRLPQEASLAGWLCRCARNLSLNHRRDEFRRRSREKLAMEDLNLNTAPEPDWARLRPVLDDAMSQLDEVDYDALVMRYFRNQDLRSVGRSLGVSDDTAQKRVARAVEKLREHLTRRGVTTTAAALSLVLSAHAVQPAPAGLAAAISAAATSNTVTTAITVTKGIAMTALQKTLVATTLAAAIGTGIYQAHRASELQAQATGLRQQYDSLTLQLEQERADASNKLAFAQHGVALSSAEKSELIRLRGQSGRMRDQEKELARLKAGAVVPSESDPAAVEMKSWLDRVKLLRARLDAMPERRIPEFQFLKEQDWLDAVKDLSQLETDADYQKALKALGSAAKHEFAGLVQGALNGYAQANNGQLPADLAQLQPYFTAPVDDSVLQGYEVTQPGTISSKSGSLIGEDGNYSSYQMQVTRDGTSVSSTGEDGLHQAIQAFLAANSGQTLTDPSQLMPYVTTPEEQTALQIIIKNYAQPK